MIVGATAVVVLGATAAVVFTGGMSGSSRGRLTGVPSEATLPATTTPTTTPTTADPPIGVGPAGVTARWVEAENAKPGTGAWALTRPATGDQIEGFANAVSVDVGGTAELYVSTTAPSYEIQAFRMGYYGGSEGRLVWSSGVLAGLHQPACPVTPALGMVQCSWTQPVAVSTDPLGWPPGDYLFKLTASNGPQSYIPLTIRDDASHSAYLVNNDVTTWEAYNTYGGYDLYQGPPSHGHTSLADRAVTVSFDRPYAPGLGDGHGAADFLGLELPVVEMMESRNLDVSYSTDIDMNQRPALLQNHHALVSLGHDEYYSLAMRSGLAAARDAGVNLMFLGANAVYRHIRLQPFPVGPDRQEIDYKDPARDPLHGHDDADVTPWAWRDPPNNAPESAILGEMWQCNPVHADMVIADPTNWMLAGTGLSTGAHIAGIVGPEFDHYTPGPPTPPNVTVVARSPVRCGGRPMEADMTYYSAPSGAGVWDTGTIDWVGSLSAACTSCAQPAAVTEITANVLAAFGVGPAGRVHPSVGANPP